jgi:hypothetical protein
MCGLRCGISPLPITVVDGSRGFARALDLALGVDDNPALLARPPPLLRGFCQFPVATGAGVDFSARFR